MVYVQLKLLSSEAVVPQYASSDAAGLDLRAAIEHKGWNEYLNPGQIQAIPTGIAIALPKGFEGQIRPRSGLALEWGITVLNAPGTIDSDYRGEIKVILINHGTRPWPIIGGTRIAQLVIAPVSTVTLTQVKELPETERGKGGFGSTGDK